MTVGKSIKKLSIPLIGITVARSPTAISRFVNSGKVYDNFIPDRRQWGGVATIPPTLRSQTSSTRSTMTLAVWTLRFVVKHPVQCQWQRKVQVVCFIGTKFTNWRVLIQMLQVTKKIKVGPKVVFSLKNNSLSFFYGKKLWFWFQSSSYICLSRLSQKLRKGLI